MIDLILSFGGSRKISRVVEESSPWLLGSRPGDPVYSRVGFTDLDFKRLPDDAYLSKYAEFVKVTQPRYCVVPDLMVRWQIPATLRFAEEHLAPHAENLILVPKVCDIIESLPHQIDGTPVILGYSCNPSYGGTPVPFWEFGDRAVHLLGSSPKRQAYIANYLNVGSLDGNYYTKIARYGRNIREDLSEAQDVPGKDRDRYYECIKLSLNNIARYFEGIPHSL